MADADGGHGGGMTEDVKDKNEERQGKQVGAEGVTEPGASLTLKER